MRVGTCELCERENLPLSKHHLRPKQKNTDGRTSLWCIPCSKQVHALYSNKELKKLDSIEKLKQEEKVQKWIDWVRKKNPSDIRYHGKARFHN